MKLGYQSELFVEKYFYKKGYRLIAHRLRTPFGELDILLQDVSRTWHMVEVKSVKNLEWIEGRISFSQKKRLLNIHQWLESKLNIQAHFQVAYVFSKEVIVMNLDIGDI